MAQATQRPQAGPDALAAAVAAELGARPVAVSRLPGGYRTDNWRIDLAGRPPVVARQYAPDRSVCAIEAGLLARLAGVAPVPEVVLADAVGRLVGVPVLVTSFVDGVRGAEVVSVGTPPDIAAVARAAGAALAAIGSLGFDRPGFFTDGELSVDPVEPGIDGALRWIAATLDRADSVDAGLRAAWFQLLTATAAAVDRAPRPVALVHSDYNPKNLLADRSAAGEWRIAAVLDWEFAYAGDPVADIGNWLRVAGDRPPAYAEAFIAGYRSAGGELPADWPARATVLDAMALADFLAAGPERVYYERALRLVRRSVEEAS